MTHITEVLRMEADVITLQDVFFAETPNEADLGRVTSNLAPLACTGLKPHFLEKMAVHGVVLPTSFFRQDESDQHPVAAFSNAVPLKVGA